MLVFSRSFDPQISYFVIFYICVVINDTTSASIVSTLSYPSVSLKHCRSCILLTLLQIYPDLFSVAGGLSDFVASIFTSWLHQISFLCFATVCSSQHPLGLNHGRFSVFQLEKSSEVCLSLFTRLASPFHSISIFDYRGD